MLEPDAPFKFVIAFITCYIVLSNMHAIQNQSDESNKIKIKDKDDFLNSGGITCL
jgi:hypothetical protein